MITSIVFDVDDTIYDQQAPYRIAVEKCFPDFDMVKSIRLIFVSVIIQMLDFRV